ncbi:MULTISPECIES: TIGR03943 family protein [unclassified Nodularia (in: cyanobacteria)]|uniref:TIGR03943 family putative permease subunit n=1 Tax=unclassified Nodularia (in: cyanobacteria) TaxID=2656917 RepID=UPI00187E2610|nr:MULTISPECIES: TIGR03943 family protein [unclassified Nodularia (in: cyanobacteria)]MBE9199536.1 TIGR03943 family protein [Nodularia sp. LEGE 06071]MCC2691349.1 TIGR03943 family protein [Nodularia sp. LEGE 04288]
MARKTTIPRQNILFPWIDALAVTSWGILMLQYWVSGKLYLLIHPNFFGLVIGCGIAFVIIGVLKMREIWRLRRRRVDTSNLQHMNLFPPGWGSALLLFVAILGLMITPRVFASDTAMQLGVTDLLSTGRAQPQSFRPSTRPEERSLVDWARTLNVYPEPDSYTGQDAKVQGFVIHPPDIGEDYVFLARFVLTCCAADAYPVGLPVKLPENQKRYPPDTWLEVEGKMITETLAGKRNLTIAATAIKEIPQPRNPYSY